MNPCDDNRSVFEKLPRGLWEQLTVRWYDQHVSHIWWQKGVARQGLSWQSWEKEDEGLCGSTETHSKLHVLPASSVSQSALNYNNNK